MFSFILFTLFLLFPFFVVLAAVYDIYSYTIPNFICVMIFFAFYAFALLNPHIGWHIFFERHITFLITFIFVFVFFNYGIFGGGDAKLIAASSLWIGSLDMFNYVSYIIFAGGALAAIIVYLRAQACYPFILKSACLKSLYFGRYGPNNIPYGISIAIGTLVTLPQTAIYNISTPL